MLPGKITPFAAPAQRLNVHAQVLLESDGIHDVPAVHRVPVVRAVDAVRTDHLESATKRLRASSMKLTSAPGPETENRRCSASTPLSGSSKAQHMHEDGARQARGVRRQPLVLRLVDLLRKGPAAAFRGRHVVAIAGTYEPGRAP